MSRTWKDSKEGVRRDAPRRNLSIRAVRRDRPDIHKLARAMLELALAEVRAEQDSRDRAAQPAKPSSRKSRKPGPQPQEQSDA